MTSCEGLIDRMPAVARGAGRWSPEEEAHLAECADCRVEWELVSAAARLGTDLEPALDAHHVSQRVLGRLRDARARDRERRRGWTLVGLAAAAAVLLAVWTGRPARPAGTGSGAAAGPAEVGQVSIPLPELDSLGAPQLEAVLDSLDATFAASPTNTGPAGLGDLDPFELQQILDSLEA